MPRWKHIGFEQKTPRPAGGFDLVRKSGAPFGSASFQNQFAFGGFHTNPKSVFLLLAALIRLKCSLRHNIKLKQLIILGEESLLIHSVFVNTLDGTFSFEVQHMY